MFETRSNRLMPDPMHLGQHGNTTVGFAISNWQEKSYPTPNNQGYREVMGFFLPKWQRGFVWTELQSVRLIESLWLGLNIGTFTFNRSNVFGGPVDNILIDGQQRMWALQQYLTDVFPVFGHYWSQVTDVDKRHFKYSTHFASYITHSEDENYLRNYYNMMNFGGVAHKESEKA